MNHLLEFCVTDRQRELVEGVIKHGSARAAAKVLGCSRTNVDQAVKAVKKRAAAKGVAPDTDLNYPLSEIERLKGRSSLVNKKTGETLLQWIKTDVSQEKLIEVMRDTIDALKDDLPRYDPVHCEGGGKEDLLSLYVVTDFHLGMKGWHLETGADWDMDIAEKLLVQWFNAAIAQAPMAETAVLANLGDFLHWDGYEPVTPTHRHVLDADTRYQKLVRVAIRVIRKIINMLLRKHQKVVVLMADANHDPSGGAWLRELFAVVYEDEPRVTVDTSADTYYCLEHGQTSLFFHHGHRRGIKDVDRVFSAKFREVFGRTKFSYGHLGHLHSNALEETQLMQVERHRTLAAPDAYAAKGGWVSGRDAKVITYHRKYGEVSRLTINPEMVC